MVGTFQVDLYIWLVSYIYMSTISGPFDDHTSKSVPTKSVSQISRAFRKKKHLKQKIMVKVALLHVVSLKSHVHVFIWSRSGHCPFAPTHLSLAPCSFDRV